MQLPQSLFVSLTCLSTLSACGQLEQPDYTGDAIVKVYGTVVYGGDPNKPAADALPDDTQISLLWLECEEGLPCGPFRDLSVAAVLPNDDDCAFNCWAAYREPCSFSLNPESDECRALEDCMSSCDSDSEIDFDLNVDLC